MKLVQTEVEVDIEDEESIEAPITYSLRDRLGDKNFMFVLLLLFFQGFMSIYFLFHILSE
tara:strand:- start:985 stop:1164 length:180 start_codon:yes stop_codon:yes gene_type:complete